MTRLFLFITLSFFSFLSCKAQVPEDRPEMTRKEFDDRLSSLLSFTVPLMGVQELHANAGKYTILDTREKLEFETSHIPGAAYLGYKEFDPTQLEKLDRNKPVVLYCSVGYRSEKIGEKLQNLGFTKVYNLYGSIFEWANQGYPLENGVGASTTQVHTYNKKWSQWLTNPDFEKTW